MTEQKFKNPRVCKLILTYSCNLNCLYCFEKFKTNDQQKNMTLETAQKIILQEIDYIEKSKKFDGLAINLFGGEPLLCFDMIKAFCEWIWGISTGVAYAISITSNGTLLTLDKKKWFQAHKDKISLSLSVDGDTAAQLLNRGVSLEDIPINFARETWPNVYFLMTVSPETTEAYADDFIKLTKLGYRLDGSHATGVNWTEEDVKKYEEQLRRIADFYLTNPQYPPNPFFLHSYADQLANKLDYFCGAGHHMIAYDYSGKGYPCHMFSPLVWGEDIWHSLTDIDFEHPFAKESDLECAQCPIVKSCPSCIAYNLQERKNVSLRDKRDCKILVAEIRVISAFQIQYYMQRVNSLNRESQVKLKAALAIYKQVSKDKVSKYIN